MRISRSFLLLAIGTQLLMSCGQTKSAPATDSVPANGQTSVSVPQMNIEVKTFEVIDSVGKSHGWGYDLYSDGKKVIHQPIIPAASGNNSFANEADAKKVGDVAAAKMKKTGSLPTILIHDLDSLGINYRK